MGHDNKLELNALFHCEKNENNMMISGKSFFSTPMALFFYDKPRYLGSYSDKCIHLRLWNGRP